MIFRIIFCICCLAFTGHNFLCSMEKWPEETSPMDTDPIEFMSLDAEFGQAVEKNEVQELNDQQPSEKIYFPVNNIQEFDFLLGLFIETAKNRPPQAKQTCLSLQETLLDGIEKLYKQNPTELVQFISVKRKNLRPEQQQIVDACLKKCESNGRFFAEHSKSVELWRCKNALFYAAYYSIAVFLVIMFLEKVGYQPGSAIDPEQIMARLDNFICEYCLKLNFFGLNK